MEGLAFCPVCGIGFRGEYERDQHFQLRHEGTRVICHGCGTSYTGLRGYEQHRRRSKTACQKDTFSLVRLPAPGMRGEVSHLPKASPQLREVGLRQARAPSHAQPEPSERSHAMRGVTFKPEDPTERAHSRTRVLPPPPQAPTASYQPRPRSPGVTKSAKPVPKSEADIHIEWLQQHLRHVRLVVGATPRPAGREPTVSVEIATGGRRAIPPRPPVLVPESLPVGGLPFRPRPVEGMPSLIREPPTSTTVRPRDPSSPPTGKPRASPAASRETQEPAVQVVPPSVRFQPPPEETFAATVREVPALAPVSDEGIRRLEEDLYLSDDDEAMTIADD